LFFAVPLFLSVALALSAIATGIRLLPLSVTLLLATVGIPKLFPNASPRLVVRLGFLALFAGTAVMVGALATGAGAEIVNLADAARRSRRRRAGLRNSEASPSHLFPMSRVARSAGVQNTVTNLGASIGTALGGAGADRHAYHIGDDRHSEQPRGSG
jgi:hypothetical protein